jgi:hypothetical protein
MPISYPSAASASSRARQAARGARIDEPRRFAFVNVKIVSQVGHRQSLLPEPAVKSRLQRDCRVGRHSVHVARDRRGSRNRLAAPDPPGERLRKKPPQAELDEAALAVHADSQSRYWKAASGIAEMRHIH